MDNVRASEPWLRVMQANMASHAIQLASHAVIESYSITILKWVLRLKCETCLHGSHDSMACRLSIPDFYCQLGMSWGGKDLMDIHTNHNSKKLTILNRFLELNIAIAIR